MIVTICRAPSQPNAMLGDVRFALPISVPNTHGSHSILHARYIAVYNLCWNDERNEVDGRIQQDTDSEAYYAAYASAQAKHLQSRLSQVNANALASLASHLRNGIPCTIPALIGLHGPSTNVSLKIIGVGRTRP